MKELALKFANGILLGFLWLLAIFAIGLGIKLSYVFFMHGWNLI